ncbi:MAG: CofH family radical SAM protein [Planctomycetes bacterium]|nr:CofH family radical SAM protein [Planctomycetota bacterium]
MTRLDDIRRRLDDRAPLGREDARFLLTEAPLIALGELAAAARDRARPPGVATYIVNTNVNLTNVCVTRCGFCSFYRPPWHPEGYVLTPDEVVGRVRAAQAQGATQVLLQGGHHPTLRLGHYEDLLRALRETGAWVHALSAPEVLHLARVEKRPLEEVLLALREAGLQTLPGAGAELLVERVRRAIAPLKARAGDWLRVHEAAHRLGIRSSATLMFGTAHDGPDDIADHLLALRALQARTGGFTALIAWTYQRGEAPVEAREVTAAEYLRVVAAARLVLDGVGTIQASPLTQGPEVAGLALAFGADDLGNVLLEEHVVASAGRERTLTEAGARAVIERMSLAPRRRDTLYRIVDDAPRGRALPVVAA